MKIAAALLLIFCATAGCAPRQAPYKIESVLMGSTVAIEICGDGGSPAARDAATGALALMRELSRKFDLFSASSELARLNAAEAPAMIPVSADMARILREARFYNIETGGAFDVTVAPLMELWGLYREKSPGSPSLPSKDDIALALARAGGDKVVLGEKWRTAGSSVKGVKIDLGAIAPGYIVDRAAEKLKGAGFNDFLIDAGGEIRVSGSKYGAPWTIGIRDPRPGAGPIAALGVHDASMATSGPYEDFVEINGKKYPHVIDPRTGYPVDNDIRSVTVVAPTCTAADALSTAVFVLGMDRGMRLIGSMPGVGCVIVTEGGGTRVIVSQNCQTETVSGQTGNRP